MAKIRDMNAPKILLRSHSLSSFFSADLHHAHLHHACLVFQGFCSNRRPDTFADAIQKTTVILILEEKQAARFRVRLFLRPLTGTMPCYKIQGHQYKDALSFLPHPLDCSPHEGQEAVVLFKFRQGFAPVMFEIFAPQQGRVWQHIRKLLMSLVQAA